MSYEPLDEADVRQRPTWDEVYPELERRHPNIPIDTIRQEFDRQRGLAIARDRYAEWEPPPIDTVIQAIPFASTAYNAVNSVQGARANARIAAGRAEPGDYDHVARAERMQVFESQRGVWGEIGHQALRLPAIFGEAYAGSAALGAARGAAAGVPYLGRAMSTVGLGAEAAAAGPIYGGGVGIAAGRAGQFGVRTAAQTALMPSMYLEGAIHNNLDHKNAAGNPDPRDPLDWRGLPAAFTVGAIQVALLGSIGGQTRSVFPGAAFTDTLKRIGVAGPIGFLEQQMADVFSSAVGLQTGYGTYGAISRREYDSSLKQTLGSWMAFTAFSMAHEPHNRREAFLAQELRTTTEALQGMNRQGMTEDAAAQRLNERLRESGITLEPPRLPEQPEAPGAIPSPPGAESGQAPGPVAPEASGGEPGRAVAGWKLHLATQKPEEVSRILTELGIRHKIGRSGGQEGKDITAYIGSREAADAAAKQIQSRAGHLLNEPHGDTLKDDISFGDRVMGRFDIGATDPDFHQYGGKGFPWLKADVDPWNRHPGADERAHAELIKRYGEFYTGKSATVAKLVRRRGYQEPSDRWNVTRLGDANAIEAMRMEQTGKEVPSREMTPQEMTKFEAEGSKVPPILEAIKNPTPESMNDLTAHIEKMAADLAKIGYRNIHAKIKKDAPEFYDRLGEKTVKEIVRLAKKVKADERADDADPRPDGISGDALRRKVDKAVSLEVKTPEVHAEGEATPRPAEGHAEVAPEPAVGGPADPNKLSSLMKDVQLKGDLATNKFALEPKKEGFVSHVEEMFKLMSTKDRAIAEKAWLEGVDAEGKAISNQEAKAIVGGLLRKIGKTPPEDIRIAEAAQAAEAKPSILERMRAKNPQQKMSVQDQIKRLDDMALTGHRVGWAEWEPILRDADVPEPSREIVRRWLHEGQSLRQLQELTGRNYETARQDLGKASEALGLPRDFLINKVARGNAGVAMSVSPEKSQVVSEEFQGSKLERRAAINEINKKLAGRSEIRKLIDKFEDEIEVLHQELGERMNKEPPVTKEEFAAHERKESAIQEKINNLRRSRSQRRLAENEGAAAPVKEGAKGNEGGGEPRNAPLEKGPQEAGAPVEPRKSQFHEANIEFVANMPKTKGDSYLGTLGDFLTGEKTRQLYKDVLDVKVAFADDMVTVGGKPIRSMQPEGTTIHGGFGYATNKATGEKVPVIGISTRDPAKIKHVLLEEGAHALRALKERSMEPSDFTQPHTELAKRPEEQTAAKMAAYAKTLDQPGAPVEPSGEPRPPEGMGAAGGGAGAEPAPPEGTPGARAAGAEAIAEKPEAGWFRKTLDFFKSFANQTFPALTRLSKASGEKLAEAANAPQTAKATWEYMSRLIKVGNKPLSEMTPEEHRFIGAVWLERRMREFRNTLMRTGEDPSQVGTLIGQEGSPLKTEADYVAGREQLFSFWEAIKQEWTPKVEEHFRKVMGIDPEDAIDSRSQIPGLPLNAIALRESDLQAPGVVGTGVSQGLENVRLRKPGFTKEAQLSAPAYDIDVAHMMQRTLNIGIPAFTRAEAVKTMIEEGVIKMLKPGERAPEGWRELALKPSHGLPDLKTNASYYAHPDAVDNIVQGLGIGERPGIAVVGDIAKPVMDKIYQFALMSPVELATHTANHVTALFRSGMGIPILNLKESFTNAFRLWNGDIDMHRKVMELAQIGASFGHEARPGILGEKLAKYDPSAYVNKFTFAFIDTMQKAVRIQLGEAYDSLVKSGHFPESETGKRDFINQALGNYNNHANNPLTQFLKDTGLQGFATAAHTFTIQGAKTSLSGAINAQATSWGSAMELRAITAIKLMPFLAMGPVFNYLRWGQAFPEDVPAFAIRTSEDEQKSHYFDPLAFTGLRRGWRATGQNALIEAMTHREQRTGAKITDQTVRDAWMSLAHLIEGPPAQFAHTLRTGENVFGRHIARRARYGESQSYENLKTAAAGVNPLIGTFTEQDRPSVPRTFLENVFRSVGPFGIKERRRRGY